MEHDAQHPAGRLGEPSAMRADLDARLALEAELRVLQAKLARNGHRLTEHALAQAQRIPSRASRERDMPIRSLSLEVAMASHQNDQTVQNELTRAWSQVTTLPATVNALEAGAISMRHVRVIHDISVRLHDDDLRGAWESVVLDYATTHTPARTHAYATQLAEKIDPVPMQERHDTAAEARDVSILDLDDGMALLQVRLPATVAYGVRDRIRRMAKEIRDAANATRAASRATAAGTIASASDTGGGDAGAGAAGAGDTNAGETGAAGDAGAGVDCVDDTRTRSQIEADVVADLLLTGAPAVDATGERIPGGLGAIRGHVQVIVPVTTLTGTTNGGALINGQVPIDPATAKYFAGQATGWDRVMCDPITGTVLATDRYTPRKDQIRFLRARDQHCRIPGCRQPAIRCQIDHNHEHHQGGPTRLDNLAHFCVRHHVVKTETECEPPPVLCRSYAGASAGWAGVSR
ncbi:DUF222 domain-containing protein [Microbacterium sp. NPDC091313]